MMGQDMGGEEKNIKERDIGETRGEETRLWVNGELPKTRTNGIRNENLKKQKPWLLGTERGIELKKSSVMGGAAHGEQRTLGP